MWEGVEEETQKAYRKRIRFRLSRIWFVFTKRKTDVMHL